METGKRINMKKILVFLLLLLPVTSQGAIKSLHSYGLKFLMPDTGQTTKYSTAFGDDSDYTAASNQPSYSNYLIGTASVTVDNNTGLMWVKDMAQASMNGTYNVANGIAACTVTINTNKFAGFTDWRLPSEKELLSIVRLSGSSPFIDTTYFTTTSAPYWPSTLIDTTWGWAVFFNNYTSGGMNLIAKATAEYIRCVRGGNTKTGTGPSNHDFSHRKNINTSWQGIQFSAGDDSNYQFVSSTPSYTIKNYVGVSSVTIDNNTGLMWIYNPSAADVGMSGVYSYENGITACENLNYAGFTDWRMPNIKEFFSITNSPLVTFDPAYFGPSRGNTYWKSNTTDNTTTSRAMVIFSDYAHEPTPVAKTSTGPIRCVRGGLK